MKLLCVRCLQSYELQNPPANNEEAYYCEKCREQLTISTALNQSINQNHL